MLTTAVPLALGPEWLNPDTMISDLGGVALWGTALVIFAECGLLLGFFLPGDSLLFTVGLFIGRGTLDQPLWLACLVLTVAAFAGNVVGYEIGRFTGPAIFNRGNSKIFKQEYVDKTMDFFEHYGPRAIVMARFVPIVRTFITVTAGVGQMDRIDEALAFRRKLAGWYRDALADEPRVVRPYVEPWADPSWWMYTVMLAPGLAARRDAVMAAMDRTGVETRPVFYPMHVLPPYARNAAGNNDR